MRYQRCTSFDSGYCYNIGLRNGLNTLGCVGYDRCEVYETDKPLNRSDKTQSVPEEKLSDSGRIDKISQNGNDGQVYLVEKIARAICHPIGEDDVLGGINKGKRRWELYIEPAMRVLEVIKDE